MNHELKAVSSRQLLNLVLLKHASLFLLTIYRKEVSAKKLQITSFLLISTIDYFNNL